MFSKFRDSTSFSVEQLNFKLKLNFELELSEFHNTGAYSLT